jgi:3-dehydroquinate synthase
MDKQVFHFTQSSTAFYFNGSFGALKEITDLKNALFITDENLFAAYPKKFTGKRTIVLKAGEKYKTQTTVDKIIAQLIAYGADRTTTLIGVGGGVITDITGYVAAVYMRGIRFGFVPTTILSMVDAAIGGKNGIDVGIYKNMVGTIRQPAFILHDHQLLQTLPQKEWAYGFAEIIKHSCIKDAAMFRLLQGFTIDTIRRDKKTLATLLRQNAQLKLSVVQRDEFEKGERKLLNFGHTLGHAIENRYKLPHGYAVSLGMMYACRLSEQLTGFAQTAQVQQLLQQYGLPVAKKIDLQAAFEVLTKDKKKDGNSIAFILLEKIGTSTIQPIPFRELKKLLASL